MEYVDIREPRCSYRNGTVLYLDLRDELTGSGIVFYDKSTYRPRPPKAVCEISCGPRSKYAQ